MDVIEAKDLNPGDIISMWYEEPNGESIFIFEEMFLGIDINNKYAICPLISLDAFTFFNCWVEDDHPFVVISPRILNPKWKTLCVTTI